MKDGGPAFPRASTFGVNSVVDDRQDGMSLRDWFAGQFLIGLVAKEGAGGIDMAAEDAKRSYLYANAMIAARELASTKDKEGL